MTLQCGPRAALLVEGISDRVAVETVSERLRIDLAAERIAVIEMGGASGIGTRLNEYGPQGLDLRLAGIYDAAEAGVIARNLGRAGIGSPITPDEMESLGFYMCVNDLEDELIRAAGIDTMQQIMELAGDLRAFRTLQRQPEWRGRPVDRQLRRFLGSGARRKTRYARLLIEATEPARLPRPLRLAIEHALRRE